MLDIFKDIRDDLKVVEKGLQESVKSKDSLVSETSTHLIMAGGKRLRPAFSLLSGKFYNYDLNSVLPLAVALELDGEPERGKVRCIASAVIVEAGGVGKYVPELGPVVVADLLRKERAAH